MASGQRPFILRDPRYPGGWALVVAWDFQATHGRSVSHLLCRTGSGDYLVHQSIDDGVVRDEIIRLDADEASRLYERMPIHFAAFASVAPPISNKVAFDQPD